MRSSRVLLVVLLATPCYSQGVQLLDPQLFGRSTTDPVKVLRDRAAGEVEPYLIKLDVECGAYYAASVFYTPPATRESVRAALNQFYKLYETEYSSDSLGLWRIENWRSGGRPPKYGAAPADSLLAIQLSSEGDTVQVIYVEGVLAAATCLNSKPGPTDGPRLP